MYDLRFTGLVLYIMGFTAHIESTEGKLETTMILVHSEISISCSMQYVYKIKVSDS